MPSYGQLINFNINLEENLHALLTSLQLSKRVSETIRERAFGRGWRGNPLNRGSGRPGISGRNNAGSQHPEPSTDTGKAGWQGPLPARRGCPGLAVEEDRLAHAKDPATGAQAVA